LKFWLFLEHVTVLVGGLCAAGGAAGRAFHFLKLFLLNVAEKAALLRAAVLRRYSVLKQLHTLHLRISQATQEKS